jgi:transcriptional regulator with XRE-family HTH domain
MTRREIFNRLNFAMGESQKAFGERFGLSRRTMSRWAAGQGGPSDPLLAEMAALVHERDPALAAEVAAYLGETLESLGIASPPPAVVSPPVSAGSPTQLVDAVVCAAAEAMDVSPRAVRPALLAALTRARELHLTRDDLLAALVPLVPPAV